MRDDGLLRARVNQSESWVAYDPTNNEPIFVDGPYGDPAQATSAGKSLAVVELEATGGGLYVVTAALTSHLEFQVNAVAKCLAQATGKGTLAF